MVGVLGAVGIGVGALVVGRVWDEPDPGPLEAATTTIAPTPAPTTTEPPSTTDPVPEAVDFAVGDYAITYRVESFSGTAVVIDTETRLHRFPFDAVVTTRPGEPSARGPLELRDVYVLGGFETGDPEENRTVLTVAPGPPSRSGHFGGDLGAARGAGLMVATGQQLEILGRDCDVHRTRGPLDVTRIEAPTDTDFADLCVTRDGLLLREEWTVGGELFRRRTAVDVDVDPEIADDAFELDGFRLPEDEGGGRVRRVTDDSTAPGVPHLVADELPDGFEHAGRFVFVADHTRGGPAQIQIDRVVTIADVHLSSRDVLVIENGGNTASRELEVDAGMAVDVRGHADARAVLRTDRTEVVLPGEDGRFVRVSSTLPLETMRSVAEALVDAPGAGGVTPFDEDLDVTGRTAPEDLEEHTHDDDVAEHTHDGSTHTHG